MHKHLWFIGALLLVASFDLMLAAMTGVKASERQKSMGARASTVRSLGLTDLSLWTEARYTRNPTQTDFFSPFQDLPGGMEHFPAGAIIAVPAHLYPSTETERP